MLRICLILGCSMLLIGLISNVSAFILEKKYKRKMQNVANNNK